MKLSTLLINSVQPSLRKVFSFNPHTYVRCDSPWAASRVSWNCFNPHTYVRCDLVVVVAKSPECSLKYCISTTCKFLSRDTKSTGDKNGTKPRKNKVKNTCSKYPLQNTSASFTKLRFCPLKNKRKYLFLSFTSLFPAIVLEVWLMQVIYNSNCMVCEK